MTDPDDAAQPAPELPPNVAESILKEMKIDPADRSRLFVTIDTDTLINASCASVVSLLPKSQVLVLSNFRREISRATGYSIHNTFEFPDFSDNLIVTPVGNNQYKLSLSEDDARELAKCYELQQNDTQ